MIGDSDSGFALSRFLRLSWAKDSGRKLGLTRFHYAGYSIVRSGTAGGIELILDHGALGMPPSYGHGHADALSLVLRIAGKTFLTDPGTYTYTGDPLWRAYFRGTRAHNTVCVDGFDQSRQESAFLWSIPFRAELLDTVQQSGEETRLLMRHFGYRHIGITHWRCVTVEASGIIRVVDWLEGEGEHDLELNWHVDANIERCDEGYRANLPSGYWVIGIQGGEFRAARAEEKPIYGWKSTKYGHKQPINTITCNFRGSVPHGFATIIAPTGQFNQSLFERISLSDMRAWIR